jgi:hypothetical protein
VTDALERALRDLAAAVDTGPVPDIAPAVLTRLREQPTTRRRRAWARITIATLVLALIVAAVPDVRGAVAGFVRDLPGMLFNTSEKNAPPVPRRSNGSLGGPLGLTGPLTLQAARSKVPFPVLAPESLGAPDEVYLRGDRAVMMLWRARPGLAPLAGSQVGAMVDVIDPAAAPIFEKMSSPTLPCLAAISLGTPRDRSGSRTGSIPRPATRPLAHTPNAPICRHSCQCAGTVPPIVTRHIAPRLAQRCPDENLSGGTRDHAIWSSSALHGRYAAEAGSPERCLG